MTRDGGGNAASAATFQQRHARIEESGSDEGPVGIEVVGNMKRVVDHGLGAVSYRRVG